VTLDIRDSKAADRYEAREDGELAGFLDYVARRDYIALIHTETLASHQGRGIGEQLVRFALGDARRRSLRVVATCPYVRAFLERHPEMQDNVVGMDPAARTTDMSQPGDA
jgi:predicted GNAT family acetyltransferase